MRKTSNPFRFVPRRAGLTTSLLAGLLLVAIVAGAATAGKSQKPKVHAAANGTARASAFALANRIRALQATEEQLKDGLVKNAAKTAARQPKTFTQKLTLASAADGPYLFAATTEATGTLTKNGGYRVTELRSRVTRTDRVAGGTTVVFDRENTYVLSLVARGGSVAFQDAKYKVSKKLVNVESKVYSGANTVAKLAPIDSGTLKLGEYEKPLCGDAPMLAAMSEKGEPVIGRAKATCTGGEYTFTAELELWRADGTRTNLGPLGLEDGVSTSMVLTGNRFLYSSPFERAAALRDVTTGSSTNLWHPGVQTADVGPDGTVALIGKSDEPQYIYYFDEYEFESTARVRATPAVAPPPNFPMPKRELNPDFRMPFVVFPQGDFENPVLVAASRARINALKFCGANLYALESKSKSEDERYEEDLIPGLGGFAQTDRAPFDVQILDTRGALIRSLGTTKPMSVTGVGCNGDRLVIIAQQGTGVKAVELGP